MKKASSVINTNTQVIISAYPKSGSTWLTRLIADILNCPSAGSHPSQDRKEIASEGWDRPGNFLVRKGHYRLKEDPINSITKRNSLIPLPHVLLPEHRTNEHIIFMIRDPRDIIVSACHHWEKRSRETIIHMVCHGGLAGLPAWDEYLKQWQQIDNIQWIRYENLHRDAFLQLQRVLHQLDYNKNRLLPSIWRQSFDNRKDKMLWEGEELYLGAKYNYNFLRKGIVGDYKDFLTEQEQDQVWDCLEKKMKEMGYTNDTD